MMMMMMTTIDSVPRVGCYLYLNYTWQEGIRALPVVKHLLPFGDRLTLLLNSKATLSSYSSFSLTRVVAFAAVVYLREPRRAVRKESVGCEFAPLFWRVYYT